MNEFCYKWILAEDIWVLIWFLLDALDHPKKNIGEMVTWKIPDLSLSFIDFMTKLADRLVRSEVMLLKRIRVWAQYVQEVNRMNR